MVKSPQLIVPFQNCLSELIILDHQRDHRLFPDSRCLGKLTFIYDFPLTFQLSSKNVIDLIEFSWMIVHYWEEYLPLCVIEYWAEDIQ